MSTKRTVEICPTSFEGANENVINRNQSFILSLGEFDRLIGGNLFAHFDMGKQFIVVSVKIV